ALERRVPERLGVDRCDDDASARRPSRCGLGRDFAEQVREVARMASRPAARGGGIVRALRAQIDVGSRHPPQLETAGPAYLLEIEVPLVAGVALVAAPDLHRGAGIP